MKARSISAALAAAALLVGCSGGAADHAESAAGQDTGSRAVARGTGSDGAAQGGGAAAPAVADQKGYTAPTRGRASAVDRAIAYVGELQVQVDDVPAASSAAVTQVRAAGGTLFGQETSLADDARSVLTFKVPPVQFERLLDSLGRLGRPLGRVVSAEDVTEQLVDLESRARTARASLERVRALLGRAGSINEIVTLEREVAAREADLEATEARLRSLEGRVEDATLTLHLSADRADLIAGDDDRGFLAGLSAGWDAFTASLAVAATALGAVLPFAALAAAAGAAAVAVRRRRQAAETESAPVA